MQVANVSFGNVIAVYGAPKKMKTVDKFASAYAMSKDVTSYYRNAAPSGLLARAAQSGNRVKLYITGKERYYIEKGERGWTSIPDILSNIQDYIDAGKEAIRDIVDTIKRYG